MVYNMIIRILISILVRFYPILPKTMYLKLMFRLRTGYRLHLNSPQTFNEKLQWLKLHDIHKEYGRLVDKVSVKSFVKEKIGEDYLIPTLGVWNSIDEVDWDSLPDSFVFKYAGDSGGVYICKNRTPTDISKIVEFFSRRQKRDFYKYTLEYPYKFVKSRFLAEVLIGNDVEDLKDYKFFCFNGKPMYVQVDCNRFIGHKRLVYDLEWNKLDLEIEFPKYDGDIDKPESLSEMIEVATRLSSGIPHVRIDLYNVKSKVYFGEMTFFHGSGYEKFRPIEWDLKFGTNLVLPAI